MVSNQFFVKQGPFPLKKIINLIKCKPSTSHINNVNINDINNLHSAKKKHITFLNSNKYKKNSLKTNAAACITSYNLSNLLPKKCIKLYVNNVLLAVTQISKLFYPNADIDHPDQNLVDAKKVKKNTQLYSLEKTY